MSLERNKILPVLLLVGGTIYFFLLAFLVFMTGQHSLDQLFLGTQYGLWMAFYMHFGWRDKIHDHISYIV
jgi:hypothetical protein